MAPPATTPFAHLDAAESAVPEAVRQRLFFAARPGREVREALAGLARLRFQGDGRHIPAEKLHLTLVFLGPVAEDTRACLESVADRLCATPFVLQLDSFGWFPRPRVLWAGASRCPQALRNLVAGLQDAGRVCGLKPDARPFKAHITLARKVSRAPPVREMDPIEWPVTEFLLMQSRTLPVGAEYSVLRTWRLANGIGT